MNSAINQRALNCKTKKNICEMSVICANF